MLQGATKMVRRYQTFASFDKTLLSCRAFLPEKHGFDRNFLRGSLCKISHGQWTMELFFRISRILFECSLNPIDNPNSFHGTSGKSMEKKNLVKCLVFLTHPGWLVFNPHLVEHPFDPTISTQQGQLRSQSPKHPKQSTIHQKLNGTLPTDP